MGVHRQLHPDLGPLGGPGVAQFADRLADHPYVQVEAHPGDVPGLLAAEQVARAADLQVLERHVHARAHLGVLRDRGQPFVGGLGQRLLRREQEVRVGPFAAAPDPAPQLVQLRQPVDVGAIHDQGVGVRDVEPGFHDRGGHQHVGLAVKEVRHDPLERVLVHLAVRRDDPGLRHHLRDPGGGPVDRGDPVVHEEHLAVTEQFAADGGGDLLVVVGADHGQHRVPFLGRGQDRGHLPDPGHAHLQGPRDGRRRHGEHVHLGPQLLEVLLVLHPEPLFLVQDDQAEPGEPGVR